MRTLSVILLLLYCCFGSLSVAAQQQDAPVETGPPKAMVTVRVQKDRILLRWAMESPISWRKANTYGYRLERHTVLRNGGILAQPEKVILETRIAPKPLEAWQEAIESNDNAAIMAQAIYGERFEVEGQDGLSAIVNVAQEQQQRFSFGLMAADRDFQVAQKAGLGYVDTAVKPGEKYVYKIVPLIPKAELETQQGGVFTGLSDYQPLPKPLDMAGVFNDKSVILTWNKKLLAATYTSYFVERSTDSLRFEKRNVLPFMNLNNGDTQTTDRAFYIDSITNGVTYYYRVKGITPFGETGPASDVVSGTGKAILKYVPHLVSKKLLPDNGVILTWEFPEEGEKQLKGFSLKRSDSEGGLFRTVQDNIPPQQRQTRYTGLQPGNYFKIEAIDKNGNSRESFAMLVQPVDSIAPVPPKGLNGTIDSTGVVQLFWEPNGEADLAGYRIYRANTRQEEFTQLTIAPWQENRFKDSVEVKNLNTEIFYRIIAEDRRHNMSVPSAVFTLKKPDVIAPSAPVFTGYKVEKKNVVLQWANSSAGDVAGHYLYRKENGDGQWELVNAFNDNSTAYTDKKLQEGSLYSYTLIAKDKSGLESQPAPAVTVVIPKAGLKPKIKGFYGRADAKNGLIRLSWRYREENIDMYQLYRAAGDGSLSLFKTLPAEAQGVVDTVELTINTKYRYLIRAVFKDGTLSEYSKTTVNY